MFNFRTLFFLFFSLLLLQGNAGQRVRAGLIGHTAKNKVFQKGKFFCDNDKDSGRHLKRKIKPKGREVAEPQIPFISFRRFSNRYVQRSVSLAEARSSFLYCLPCKRGPPSI